MKWSDVENALKELEGPYQDFKESTFLKDTKEILVLTITYIVYFSINNAQLKDSSHGS